MTSTTTPSGVRASTTSKDYPELGKRLEQAFFLAAERFKYWRVELSGLTPIIVDIPEKHPLRKGFTFATTAGMSVLVSTRVLELGWSASVCATVLVHELMHHWQKHEDRGRALGIDQTFGSQAAADWNSACDFEINDDLEDAGCEFPVDPDDPQGKKRWGLFPDEYKFPRHLTAEEYFALIISERAKNSKPTQSMVPMNRHGCGSGAGAPNPLEDELGLREKRKTPSNTEEGEEEGGGSQRTGKGDGAALSLADFEKSEDECAAIGERMDASLDKALDDPRMQGSIPAGMRLDAQRRRKRTRVDWKRQLARVTRRAVQTVKGSNLVNWARLARRTFGEFLRPTASDRKVRAMIVMDTSGSMVHLLEVALTQVFAVLEATRAEVIWCQCDAEIAELRQISSVAEAMKITLKGGGGTDFRPPFELVGKMPPKGRPQILIYLTDGYGTAPQRPVPGLITIWAMLGGTEPPATWGEVVLIPADE